MANSPKINSLLSFLSEKNISPTDLVDACDSYVLYLRARIEDEINHYDYPLEYILAKGLENDVEAFILIINNERREKKTIFDSIHKPSEPETEG